ncbi:hypothetical protein IMG5_170590 [Ichthyophthirius multifiliis]|uniref:Aspartyl/asparaginy/proline hydroxylase domain-containing protein n=1 Tax=Ichthyophthirius multifiliis TaxID=5932 RepID=G0R1H4_ICHMU|nr:hypothetical protein IMG5_170590 [Ichthyophthirius multifiliis]EGR28675.1 hypothetical protein IMG5_170590 [Ichthyophthirius multifiliis]|eukprot:XP_004029911.1 hypothetical protein IMG5_170590 [Ichthyophthirius multifiliis]
MNTTQTIFRNSQNLENAPPQQKGCPEIIPGLRAQPIWTNQDLTWITQIETHFQEIKEEVLSLRNQKGFQPYRGPSWTSNIKPDDGVGRKSTDQGDWNVFYLYLHNLEFTENCKKVPKIMNLIVNMFPRHYCHAFISAMQPNTHILKHNGPTNKKLRFHMPLIGVKDSRLRVGEHIIEQQEGKCYVFDDSFEHEAWHNGPETRIILIIDIWHPDLSNQEIKFLSLIQNAKMKFEKQISELDNDNFYKIIEMSKSLIENNDWWNITEQNIL